MCHEQNGYADWQSVAENMEAFEKLGNLSIKIGVFLAGHGKAPDLVIRATASTQMLASAGPVELACAQLTCSGTRLKTMAAVLTQVLYMLDFQLAEQEAQKSVPKRA